MLAACVAAGCGRAPTFLGVLVNELSLTKTWVEPGEQTSTGRTPAHDKRAGGTTIQADVLGDAALETLVATARGEGIEVLDQRGQRASFVSAPGYLTDFSVLPAANLDKQDLVLYMYPNDAGGGTFTVLTPHGQATASWTESPAPGGFAVGRWDRRDAIVYLRSGHLVMRSREGRELLEIPVPESDAYDVRHTIAVGAHTIVVASGDGYTPFHMVLVLEPGGRLVFAEVERDQASHLESIGAGAFTVRTRSGGWRYSLPPSRVP
jgi:hypothetical protein